MTPRPGSPDDRSRFARERGFRAVVASVLLVAVLPVAVWATENPALVTSALGGYTAAHIVPLYRRRIARGQHLYAHEYHETSDDPFQDP